MCVIMRHKMKQWRPDRLRHLDTAGERHNSPEASSLVFALHILYVWTVFFLGGGPWKSEPAQPTAARNKFHCLYVFFSWTALHSTMLTLTRLRFVTIQKSFQQSAFDYTGQNSLKSSLTTMIMLQESIYMLNAVLSDFYLWKYSTHCHYKYCSKMQH